MTSTVHAPATLHGRTEAEAHVGVTCFKLGPPALIGAELEWLLQHAAEPARRPGLTAVVSALGAHAPSSLAAGSPADPMRGGSTVTVEPGGQVELSSAPRGSAALLCRSLAQDAADLRALLAAQGLCLQDGAADALRRPHRVLTSPRYEAMEAEFDRIGPYGRLMMCNTAAVQVSVDAGAAGEQVRQRWTLLHEVGPALLAAFACSPLLRGAPPGRWASQRMRTWFELDPARTTGPVLHGDDPAQDYARWAVAVPLLCVRADSGRWTAPHGATFADWVEGRLDDVLEHRPTTVDLNYHLSTLFPPVRACGHLEVRYVDAQPGDGWRAVVAVFDGLLRDGRSTAAALELAHGTRDRWRDAARLGLADGELRAAAAALLELAWENVDDPELAATVGRAVCRTRAGLPPGEEHER